ncbi:MAG: LytTR family transcriptional regulator [Bacteroidales bacterium]|nr:LytTR family transcriptional regulator [Bacteroidales bacterium]
MSYLCNGMNERQKETLKTRVTSVGFAILAFAVFKPFGLGGLGWTAYPHLLVILLLGIGVCYLTEAVLKHIVRMPATLDKGVDYIIKRNLRFQMINTPLEALMVCTYLHFVMRGRGLESPLSWGGFFGALLILAFCSFAVGLYWRFKFRSRYLAAELEELKQLNKGLTESRPAQEDSLPEKITLTGTTSDNVTLRIQDILYVESLGNYVKVCHLRQDKVCGDMLRTTLNQVEKDLGQWNSIIRCHRAFIVNLSQVERISSSSGGLQLLVRHSGESIPVSRSHTSDVKARIREMEKGGA